MVDRNIGNLGDQLVRERQAASIRVENLIVLSPPYAILTKRWDISLIDHKKIDGIVSPGFPQVD